MKKLKTAQKVFNHRATENTEKCSYYIFPVTSVA